MDKQKNSNSIGQAPTAGHQLYQRFSSFFGKIYTTELNPLYQLGGISVLLFVIACISGIYVFIFYNLNPRHAWDSVEAMSNNYFNGWMRSIHRYSSDLLVVFILLHMLHTIINSKFKRILSWVSGIISFLIVVLIGVTGFILVWDQKAKLIGYLTATLFSKLPIFDPSIAGAFLLNDLTIVGGFFKVALFGHIALSLVTVVIIWIHILKISKPKIFPPKKLIVYSVIALGIVSIIFPVKSDLPAQVTNLPTQTTFDWYYYFGYYLMKIFTVSQNWFILVGSGILLSIVPFIFKRKNRQPVFIDLEKCNACNLCSYDCPYEAIDMLIHKGERKAILSPDKCVGCNICIGSCDEHAISHPDFPIYNLQTQEKKVDITVFRCSYFPKYELPSELNIVEYPVTCLGSVMPKDVQKILDNNSEKVAFLGCEDCYYRLGKTWAINRFLRKRAPLFSKKFDAARLQLFTLTQYSKEKLLAFAKVSDSNETKNTEMKIHDNIKGNAIISVLIMTLFFSLMVPLSSTVVHFFNPKEKTLIVNFKYISTPTEYEENKSSEKHMQTLTPMVKKRSSVMLKIYSSKDQELLFEKEFVPRGMRNDIAMFIYSQMTLQQDAVDVEVSEISFPEIIYRINKVPLKEGDGTFVIFKDKKLEVASKIE